MTHLGSRHRCGCAIASPDLLAHLAEKGATAEQRRAAINALAASASMRTQRTLTARVGGELMGFVAPMVEPTPAGEARQTVYDLEARGRDALPGTQRRSSGDPPTGDDAVDDVFDATQETYETYSVAFGRDSVDGEGMPLAPPVHYGQKYNNAFWNGAQMVFGDGDGHLPPVALTIAIDVIGHELTHGVTQHMRRSRTTTSPAR